MTAPLGVALLLLGGVATWRLVRGRGPFRAGPWPGLSAQGAELLLSCAVLLAGGQLVVGNPRGPLPDLPLLSVLALAPLVLATRIVGAPGAAAAVCGAYLLPRTLVSLLVPSIEPPPLLLVPAIAFEVGVWLRASDIASLAQTWPRQRSPWRRHRRRPRRLKRWRISFGGALFGLVLAAVEPPFAILLGADPAVWSGPSIVLAGAWSAGGCAIVGAALSGRDTGP